MVDFPLFYPKKLFNKKEFLFYLLKSNKNNTFKLFFKNLNLNIKNKEDITLINSLFNFSLKFNNFKSCFFIFENIIRECKYNDKYDILTHMLLKITLKNKIDFSKYANLIISNWIDFYNSNSSDYNRKIYPNKKRSYEKFMNHYEEIFSFLLSQNDHENILLLAKTFYPERFYDYDKFEIIIVNYLNNDDVINVSSFLSLIKHNFKNNSYLIRHLEDISFKTAFENENISFLFCFFENYNMNLYQLDSYFKTAIKKESFPLLSFIIKNNHLYESYLNELIEKDYFFTSCFYINYIKSSDFLDKLFKSFIECYMKKNQFGFGKKDHSDSLSKLLTKILSRALRYNRINFDSDTYKENIKFSLINTDDIHFLLKKYYLNDKCYKILKEFIEEMKYGNKKIKVDSYIKNLNNAKKIRTF